MLGHFGETYRFLDHGRAGKSGAPADGDNTRSVRCIISASAKRGRYGRIIIRTYGYDQRLCAKDGLHRFRVRLPSSSTLLLSDSNPSRPFHFRSLPEPGPRTPPGNGSL